MQTKGLLPGRRGTVLVVGVIDDHGGVDINMQPLASRRGSSGSPRCCPRRGPGSTHPGQVGTINTLIDQPPHRGGRGFRPENVLTVTAQLADAVDAIRPVSDRSGQIGEHLAGGIHPQTAVGVGQCRGDLGR